MANLATEIGSSMSLFTLWNDNDEFWYYDYEY